MAKKKSSDKPMTLRQAMSELKKLGSAGTKKIYLRHGATEPLFGVKFGDLGKLQKRIGTDHELACELWETENSDARTLALMVVDPDQFKSADIDAWLKPLEYDLLIGMLCGVVAKTKHAASKWKKWSSAKAELKLVAAYDLLAAWLKESAEDVPKATIAAAIKGIQADIHEKPNLARHAMNNAIIAIGVFRSDFEARAIAAAKKIGKVEVDHGQTNCKTPDAAGYIQKAVAHQRKRLRC